MTNTDRRGRVTAKINRDRAIARYYSDPKTCEHCNQVIQVRAHEIIRDVRRKRFCNRSCAAFFHHGRPEPAPRLCQTCGEVIVQGSRLRKYCADHPRGRMPRVSIGTRTKGNLFATRPNWQSARNAIRNHAKTVFAKSGLPLRCYVCNYDYHVQIAHKVPVSNFPKSAPLSQVNAIDNLVALCPNHHWEYDHGKLTLL